MLYLELEDKTGTAIDDWTSVIDRIFGDFVTKSDTNPRYDMVPTRTGNQGKPGKMERHFPVREKSGNFVKTGKVREFYSKYLKNQKKKLHWKIEKKKNTGKVREICQPVIVKTLQIWYHNKKKNFKNTGKLRKMLEKSEKSQGNLSVRKRGKHEYVQLLYMRFLAHLVYRPKRLIQSCFVRCASSSLLLSLLTLSVHTSPSHRFKHRNFLFCTEMHLFPL